MRLCKHSHPAYHLRPNKAIDRLRFLELIRTFDLYERVSESTYIGMGGPFLEDFRLIANSFPDMRMVSIDYSEETLKRQKFHKCSRRMKFHCGEFGDYVTTEFPNEKTITWADFTAMGREELQQISDVSRKMLPNSILRVTVEAESDIKTHLGLRDKQRIADREERGAFNDYVDRFRSNMSLSGVSLDDEWFIADEFEMEKYPGLLANIIEATVQSACTKPKRFVPLAFEKYSDGTIMLSVTGMFCTEADPEKNGAKVIDHFTQHGILQSDGSPKMVTIDVPRLTTKERMHLEPILPSAKGDGKATARRLKYSIETEAERNLYRMQQYEKHYRHFPYFGRLSP